MTKTGKPFIPSRMPAGDSPIWKIIPTLVVVVLFLVSEKIIGQFDPHAAAHNPAYGNLVENVSVRAGDNPAWSAFSLPSEAAWETVPASEFAEHFQGGTFWARTTVDLGEEEIAGKRPVVFLAGAFSADVYLNGTYIGRKGEGQRSEGEYPTVPYSVYIEVDDKTLRAGANVLAVRITPGEGSLFIKPDLQAFSFNLLGYSQFNIIYYYFILAYLFLFSFMSMATFLRSFQRKIGDKGLNTAYLAASIFIVLNLLLVITWFSSGQPTGSLNLMIFLYAASMIGSLACYLFTFGKQSLKGTRSFWFLGVFVTVSFASLFFKKDFLFIFLFLQYIFFGFAAWKVLVKENIRVIFLPDYMAGFMAYPVLAFYKPDFMATFGFYIFASAYIITFSIKRFRELQTHKNLNHGKQYLAIYSKGQRRLLDIDKIHTLAAVRHYTEVILANGKRYIYHKGLAALLRKLPGNFVRVHKSYAINMDYMKALMSSPGSRYEITLKTGGSVPVGRKYLPKIKDRMI